MTKQRANYLYKFLGLIQKKYRRLNPKHTQHFYQLKLKLESQNGQKIFAFKDKTPLQIWNALETDSYVGKKYLLTCRNYQGSYYLVDWKEIKAEGELHA